MRTHLGYGRIPPDPVGQGRGTQLRHFCRSGGSRTWSRCSGPSPGTHGARRPRDPARRPGTQGSHRYRDRGYFGSILYSNPGRHAQWCDRSWHRSPVASIRPAWIPRVCRPRGAAADSTQQSGRRPPFHLRKSTEIEFEPCIRGHPVPPCWGLRVQCGGSRVALPGETQCPSCAALTRLTTAARRRRGLTHAPSR